MECAVFDTYVTRKNGELMHFDIIVPEKTEQGKVFDFGYEYLETKGEEGQSLTASECQFCHIEKAEPRIEEAIKSKGYFILEL